MGTDKQFSKFVPERLAEAREIRGMTTKELAEAVGVSQQAISKFEKPDKTDPGYDTLEKLSSTLHVPVTFFYKQINPVANESIVFFRSKSAATVKSKKVHANKLKWIREVSSYLDHILGFPDVNIPIFTKNTKSFIPTDFNDIEEIALKVRENWGLGNGPISNLVLLLEKNGAVVARSPFSNYDIDACSIWLENERPLILLSNDKTAARSRFDIAHELGHLVLHSHLSVTEFNKKENFKLIEKEANYFASAFLLPSPSFGREIFSTSIDYLISLKKRWKVSINAMAYRAKQLRIFSDYQYIYIKNKLAQQNWLKNEPLDNEIPFENPSLLKQAVEAVIENDIKTKQDFISEIGLLREEIEAISGLDPGYLLSKEGAKIFNFKLK